MRLLLDTHALLWWLGEPERLKSEAYAAIGDGGNDVVVSAVSAWEASIKIGSGKLKAPSGIQDPESHGFSLLSVTYAHGVEAGSLPPHHRDPFDRMLVAQARLEGLTIVTRDPRIRLYDVAVLRA